MITDQDVTKLKKVFATKKDLKEFVTKDDLKKALAPYATKSDLEKFVSSQELEKILEQYPTKDNLKAEIKTVLDAMLQFKDDILTEVKKNREETVIVSGYKDRIEDHEDRIEKLERVALPQ